MKQTCREKSQLWPPKPNSGAAARIPCATSLRDFTQQDTPNLDQPNAQERAQKV